MEALELYKAEERKMEEYKYACRREGKEVHTHYPLYPTFDNLCVTPLLLILEAKHLVSIMSSRC